MDVLIAIQEIFGKVHDLLKEPSVERLSKAKVLLQGVRDSELEPIGLIMKRDLFARVEAKFAKIAEAFIETYRNEIRSSYAHHDYDEVESKIQVLKQQFGEYLTKSDSDFFDRNRVALYHGVRLNLKEVSALLELERVIGEPIPMVVDTPSFGYTIRELNVIKLGLFEQGLSSFPESILSFGWLEVLYLDNNRLSSLPESISLLQHLRWFSLSRNHLSFLPKDMPSLQNLQELFLNANLLTSLPENIFTLPSLRVFYVDVNELSSLPEVTFSRSKLEVFDLGNNQLSSFPESVSLLRNLVKLGLSKNRLTSLPESMVSLKKLKKLNLSNNNLSSLPEGLSSLPNLKELDLRNNPLSSS